MENKNKVIFIGLLIIQLFNFSCNNLSNNCTIENNSFSLKEDSLNNQILEIKKYSNPNRIDFVQVNGKLHKLGVVVDCNSFINIFDSKDSIKILNDYFKANPIIRYFKDRNYLYFYIEDSNYLVHKGKSNEYEVLGDSYLTIDNKVFYDGKEVIGADISSFNVITVHREKSEWMKTVGLDNKNIYNGENKMNEATFNRFFWNNKDSLKQIYFNDSIEID